MTILRLKDKVPEDVTVFFLLYIVVTLIVMIIHIVIEIG